MIGIYKITNLVNSYCYIGQSRNILKRWSTHKFCAYHDNEKYDYPLYRAFRKYGIDNFSFEVLQECTIDQLNELEYEAIKTYNPEYNQTIGVDYNIIPQKLSYKQVNEIQNILLEDQVGAVSHKDLAIAYGVSADTIRDINVGRTWFNEKYIYPLHYSKFDSRNPNKIKEKYCIDCGKPISKKATRCGVCENKQRIQVLPVTREELKNLIRTTPFTTIAKKFNMSDNGIRKWCIKYNLPTKVRDIKAYTDLEWEKI